MRLETSHLHSNSLKGRKISSQRCYRWRQMKQKKLPLRRVSQWMNRMGGNRPKVRQIKNHPLQSAEVLEQSLERSTITITTVTVTTIRATKLLSLEKKKIPKKNQNQKSKIKTEKKKNSSSPCHHHPSAKSAKNPPLKSPSSNAENAAQHPTAQQNAKRQTGKTTRERAETPPPPPSSSSSSSSASAASPTLSPPKGLDKGVALPFTRLDNHTWLHDRSERDVYRLLVDVYRLRVEDMYRIEGQVVEDSLYEDEGADLLLGFRRFLGMVQGCSRHKLLPSWWTGEKKKECEALGMSRSQWHSLNSALPKSDVVEHYGDPQFPMQLRMFGEAVYGSAPGGTDGTAMRRMMAAMEKGMMGDMAATHLDLSPVFGGR
ncbi:hypothetical protein L249_1939 [Ophiocordyceps polyrhachis-furcata BCC 54312]|uniref:Uncharacterized protein n=1 Tax=Ophiocordyceps polyrhachis-furcata BCC 54312 TaxID=1330021 RepID=A0A367LN77_9HYPO|nr:hypothetical protein L249_1939 [Ophiocordyceps polyrhachis-furcata BCC 54312]